VVESNNAKEEVMEEEGKAENLLNIFFTLIDYGGF